LVSIRWIVAIAIWRRWTHAVQVTAAWADVAESKREVEAVEAKVEAAKCEVEAAKREVEAAKHEFRAATDADEKSMLREDWKTARDGLRTAQKGLDDVLAFAKSQRDRLVQLQQASDNGTLPQHSERPVDWLSPWEPCPHYWPHCCAVGADPRCCRAHAA
jgi:chromosome segregation ATPase